MNVQRSKRMSTGVIFLSGLLVANLTWAFPTARPLPNRLKSTSKKVEIFRDHEIPYKFYLLPKSIKISNFQIPWEVGELSERQKQWCRASDQFSEARANVLEQERELTERGMRLSKLLTDLTARVAKLFEKIEAFEDRGNQIGDKIIENQLLLLEPGLSEGDRSRLLKENTELTNAKSIIEELVTKNRNSLTENQRQIDRLEEKLKKLPNEINTRLAEAGREYLDDLKESQGEVLAVLDILSDLDQNKQEIGFEVTDRVEWVPLRSFRLFSADQASGVSYLSQLLEWLDEEGSKKFKGKFFPSGMDLERFRQMAGQEHGPEDPLIQYPREIQFRKGISALEFCQIYDRDTQDLTSSYGIGAEILVPIFEDDLSTTPIRHELFQISAKITPDSLAHIEKWTQWSQSGPVTSDPGHPSLYPNLGKVVYQKLSLNPSRKEN